MIFTAIFSAALAVAGWAIGFLPDGDPLGLTVPTGIVVGYTWANSFLPLTETFAALTVFVGVYLALMGLQAARAVWRLVPIIGGG